MPPVNPPIKRDGPACRVCGCTEHNACVIQAEAVSTPIAKGVRMPAVRMPRLLTCSWVETSGNDEPRWLCSACAGTHADALEAIDRGMNILLKSGGQEAARRVVLIARALQMRTSARLRWDAGQTISAVEAVAIGARNMSNH